MTTSGGWGGSKYDLAPMGTSMPYSSPISVSIPFLPLGTSLCPVIETKYLIQNNLKEKRCILALGFGGFSLSLLSAGCCISFIRMDGQK